MWCGPAASDFPPVSACSSALPIVTAVPVLGTMAEPAWMHAAMVACSFSFLICAFFLFNRLAVSRTPALSVLAATFLCAGALMFAQTYARPLTGAWLSFYAGAVLAFGLVIFAGIDDRWAGKQRKASFGNGYYADDRDRFLRLTSSDTNRWLMLSVAGAVVATTALVYASATNAFEPLRADVTRFAGAVVAGAIGLAMLAALPAWRRMFRSLRSAAAAATFGSAVAVLMWAPQLMAPLREKGLSFVPGPFDFVLVATIATIGFAMLVFASGHATVFRWALVVCAAATALGSLGSAAWLSGLYASPLIPDTLMLVAALVPLSTLLCDAKAVLRYADDQATALKESSLVDGISGIGSNRCLRSHIERQIALADHSGTGFTLAMFDIQGVKAHNRVAGGHAGTRLIAFAGLVLKRAFAPTGLACRIKGDEFAVLFPPGSAPHFSSICRDVETTLAREQWRVAPLQIGLYADAFTYDPTSPVSAERFLSFCLDQATRSKKSGGAIIGAPHDVSMPAAQRTSAGARLRGWARASLDGALHLPERIRIRTARFAARFKHDSGHIV